MTEDKINSSPIPDGLEQAIYWMSAGRDDFDIFGFRAALPGEVHDEDNGAVLVPSASNESDYHAFFAWNVDAEEVGLSVEYRVGEMEHVHVPRDGAEDTPIDGPSADHLMAWLGQFFKDKEVPSHLHVRYRYPYESRSSIIPFSLDRPSPLPGNAEIYGIALRLPDKPSGAMSVRLTGESSDWYAEIIADRVVNFVEFSPFADAVALQGVLKTFLIEDGAK